MNPVYPELLDRIEHITRIDFDIWSDQIPVHNGIINYRVGLLVQQCDVCGKISYDCPGHNSPKIPSTQK
jgi:hypothetical protein